MNTPVSTLLAQKDSAVFSVTPNTTVAQAVREMNRRRVGSVLVMDGTRICGIFTERDVLKRVVAQTLPPETTSVSRVMTVDVHLISPETSTDEAMAIMTEKRHRHLPVVADGELLGVISIGDITRWLVQSHRNEADNLWHYITGSYPS